MALAALAVAYGLAVNLLAFALFGIDKRRAVAGAWRISEGTLIRVALLGGWPGAKAGQRRFRHKTRKQPFGRRLNAAGLLSLGLLLLLLAASLAPAPEGGWRAEVLSRFEPVLSGEAWQARTTPPDHPLPTRFGPGSDDGM